MAKKSSRKAADAPDLSHITPDLQGLATPIDQLVADPKNARRHDQQSIDAVAASLKRYGQRKPIVVNRAGNQIEAGHGTFDAAKALGWTHIAAVFVDDDQATATGYAIADNRTAEFSEWDQQRLEELLSEYDLAHQETELFDALLLNELIEDEPASPAARSGSGGGEGPTVEPIYAVAIELADEGGQKAMYARMSAEGYKCRLMTL